jgi:hypothetical protein
MEARMGQTTSKPDHQVKTDIKQPDKSHTGADNDRTADLQGQQGATPDSGVSVGSGTAPQQGTRNDTSKRGSAAPLRSES